MILKILLTILQNLPHLTYFEPLIGLIFKKQKAFSVCTGLSDYYKLVSCHNTKNQLSEIQTSSNKL